MISIYAKDMEQLGFTLTCMFVWNRILFYAEIFVTFRCDDGNVADVKMIQCDAEFMHD